MMITWVKMLLTTFMNRRDFGGRQCKNNLPLSICVLRAKGRFPLQPYRSETYRMSLFRDNLGRTNDMHTLEYATFRHSIGNRQ